METRKSLADVAIIGCTPLAVPRGASGLENGQVVGFGLRRYFRVKKRVARVDGTLYYVHSDHPSASLRADLGSIVTVSDGAGQASLP